MLNLSPLLINFANKIDRDKHKTLYWKWVAILIRDMNRKIEMEDCRVKMIFNFPVFFGKC